MFLEKIGLKLEVKHFQGLQEQWRNNGGGEIMKRSKYNASKMRCGQGHIHDSKKEAWRCNELHQMLERGEITDLQIQPAYILIGKHKYPWRSEREVRYVADFAYRKSGVLTVEDVKSEATRKDEVYILKRKLFEERYRQGSE